MPSSSLQRVHKIRTVTTDNHWEPTEEIKQKTLS